MVQDQYNDNVVASDSEGEDASTAIVTHSDATAFQHCIAVHRTTRSYHAHRCHVYATLE